MNELTMFEVWLWLQLDDLKFFFGLMAFIFAFATLFLCMGASTTDGNDTPFYAKIGVLIGISLITVSVSLAVLIPSTRNFAVIYALPKIANSEAIREDIPEVYGMAMDRLKEFLTEEER